VATKAPETKPRDTKAAGRTAATAIGVEAAGRLRTAVARISRRLRHTQSDRALSPSEWEVLATVARSGSIRVADLAAAEGFNPTMLSRIAAKLEAGGLVERVQDREDGRVAHLAVTATGRRLHAAVRAERTDALLVALDRLTERDRRALVAALPALEAVADHLREDRP
jgi:DNA-binding MarR family transcriptional regulator